MACPISWGGRNQDDKYSCNVNYKMDTVYQCEMVRRNNWKYAGMCLLDIFFTYIPLLFVICS